MIATNELPTFIWEQLLWREGYKQIGGVDEAGRGALAGPVAAATVILPAEPNLLVNLHGVRDSKQMTPLSRQAWSLRIKEIALAWGVGFASNKEIDTIGILPATRLAVLRAIDSLAFDPDYLLTDFLLLPEIPIPQTAFVKGDQQCLSIAAASILAKTSRDNWMCKINKKYPGYSFVRHKGYGTQAHFTAIHRLGLCKIHRKTFSIRGARNELLS